MTPVYISKYTPGIGAIGVEWTSVCHTRTMFLWIHHQARRDTSRWVSVERKRPFVVTRYLAGRFGLESHEVGASATLDGAVRIAAQWAALVAGVQP